MARQAAILKLFANYGLAGIIAGYLLIYTIPEAQQSFTTAIAKQADQSREDRKAAMEHGERAVERLSQSIDGLSQTFGENQSKVRGNQGESITIQKRMVELLEQQAKPD